MPGSERTNLVAQRPNDWVGMEWNQGFGAEVETPPCSGMRLDAQMDLERAYSGV